MSSQDGEVGKCCTYIRSRPHPNYKLQNKHHRESPEVSVNKVLQLWG